MEILATVETVDRIYAHPDPVAERIEIAVVGNFHCVVRKGDFQVGQLCVLIQPDTRLPEAEWTVPYGGAVRVKARKIRGFTSYGIVVDPSVLGLADLVVGQEVGESLGIAKYVAPATEQSNGQTVFRGSELPYNMPKTDESRWQNVRDLPYGELVWVTLKVDGQSVTYCAKDGEFIICSRERILHPSSIHPSINHIRRYDLESQLLAYSERHGVNLALRGESYGGSIQKMKPNPHASLSNDVAFFSVWLIDENRYATPVDRHSVYQVCEELGLPVVPLFERAKLTPELIQKYQNMEYLPGTTNRLEGVVMTTDNGLHFKVINLPYDLLK